MLECVTRQYRAIYWRVIIHRQFDTSDVSFDENSVKVVITEVEGSIVLSVDWDRWVGPTSLRRVAFIVENDNDLQTHVTA